MSERRPDVLWLYCDELRADALGCYGAARATPAMDALAARGVRFTSSWCNSPVCVPSRTSLLTGLLPEQTGVFHNEGAVPGVPVARELITFPEVLAAAGYRTISVGKEHIPAELNPWQVYDPRGSAQNWVTSQVRAAITDPIKTALGPVTGHVSGDYPPAQQTAAALERLGAEADTDAPLFFRASYLQPHTPVVVPSAYSQPGTSGPAPRVCADPQVKLSEFEEQFAAATPQIDQTETQAAWDNYHDLVAWVDDQISEVVQEFLAIRPHRAKVIILTADHGANIGENGTWGKHTFSPQSQRVPLIIVAEHLAASVRDDLVQSIDLGRTVLGLCQVDVPDQFGGRDLFADPEPHYVLSTIGYGEPESRAYPNKGIGSFRDRGWPRRSCIRTKRYRLDLTTRIDGAPATTADLDPFLADVVADPDEVHNLAFDPDFQDVRDELERVVLAHAATAHELPTGMLAQKFSDYLAQVIKPVLTQEKS